MSRPNAHSSTVMPTKELRFPALFLFSFYALYGIMKYFEQIVYFDFVLLYDTIWADVLDVLAHLLEVCGIAALIGFLLYAILQYGAKNIRSLYLLAGGALLFKYVTSTLAVGLAGGMLYFPEDLFSLLLSFLIESVEITFATILGHTLIRRSQEKNAALDRAATVLGRPAENKTEFLPFRRIISFQNPLQKTTFWSVLVVCGFRTMAYIIDEIAYTAAGALFSAADIPVTLLYWLILVAIPTVAGYFLALGCILLAAKRAAKPHACKPSTDAFNASTNDEI